VSLGYGLDGKRVRKKVSGQTKSEVKDKLKDLHTDLDAGVRPVRGYTVGQAVADWLAVGLPGRTAKTIKVNRDSLKPVLARIGTRPLQDLTAADVRAALTAMAATHATRTVQKAHNCLTRAIRHAEAQDLVRRNVSALVDTPRGRTGRPSQSLTLEQATALLAAAERSRLHAYIALCLLTGIRSEEARALTWDHVDLDAGTMSVWRSVRPRRHEDPAVAPDAETARGRRQSAARAQGAPGRGNGTMPGRCGKSMRWSWLPRWARRWTRTTSGATSAR
jgi:integrase